MRILDVMWFRLLAFAQRAHSEERGEGLVTWVVLAVGLAAAAAAVVAIVSPAVQSAAEKVVSTISGG
jgi:hypothetical protein